MNNIHVLVIEDNQNLAAILVKKLEMKSYSVHLIKNGLEAVAYLRGQMKTPPHCVILDLMLPGRSGGELLSAIKSILPDVKIFVFSAYQEYAYTAPQELVEGFFLKTDGIDQLLEAIEKTVGKSEA